MTSEEVRAVSDGGKAMTRPVGWWLKEADALLDAAFDAALLGTEVDRRGWQILTTLARQPMGRPALLAALASFDPPEVVERAIVETLSRGWVEASGDVLRLTSAGSQKQQTLHPHVARVRDMVSAALPQEDYAQLVGLLARLVEGIRRHGCRRSSHRRRTVVGSAEQFPYSSRLAGVSSTQLGTAWRRQGGRWAGAPASAVGGSCQPGGQRSGKSNSPSLAPARKASHSARV
jgi:hypothetical protein